jgi:hypothetical protein
MKQYVAKFLIGLSMVTAGSFASGQTYNSLAIWTFETSKPTTAGPHTTEEGIMGGMSYASTNTGGAITNPSGVGGSSESFAAAGWNVGEYFQFSAPTLGYADISLRFDQTSSTSGPKSFDVLYGTDGINFQTFGNYTVGGGNNYSSHTFNMSMIDELDDVERVYFRLSLNSNAAAGSTGTVQGSGTSRIDLVSIRAATVIPEPSVALMSGIALLSFFKRRR